MVNTKNTGLGLSPEAKLVLTNDRPSTFSIIFRLFPSGDKRKLRRILHDLVERTPRHSCRNFRERNRRSDLPVFNIKQNLAKKLDPALKPSHLKEITYLTHFYAQKSKCPRRFREIDPEILHTCSTLHAHPEA